MDSYISDKLRLFYITTNLRHTRLQLPRTTLGQSIKLHLQYSEIKSNLNFFEV